MGIKSTYFQGETIDTSVSVSGAVAVVFRWFPVRSDALKSAAASLLSSQKQSLSVGEISMSDKTADEIASLAGIVDASTPSASGAVSMTFSSGAWSCSVDTSSMFGSYRYGILSTSQSGVVTLVDSGTFEVDGDSAAASMGGGIGVINTRFC